MVTRFAFLELVVWPECLAIEAVRAGAREIVVQARNLPRAEHLVGEVQRRGFRHISALPEPEGDSMDCNVVLNGTPVGMWPHVDGLPVTMRQLEGVQAVFDTIYNPTATRLVLRAKSRDMWTMGGLQMLFAQAPRRRSGILKWTLQSTILNSKSCARDWHEKYCDGARSNLY